MPVYFLKDYKNNIISLTCLLYVSLLINITFLADVIVSIADCCSNSRSSAWSDTVWLYT